MSAHWSPNPAAHPEHLKQRSLWHPSSRRPGGRERWTSTMKGFCALGLFLIVGCSTVQPSVDPKADVSCTKQVGEGSCQRPKYPTESVHNREQGVVRLKILVSLDLFSVFGSWLFAQFPQSRTTSQLLFTGQGMVNPSPLSTVTSFRVRVGASSTRNGAIPSLQSARHIRGLTTQTPRRF